jgi:hypothetical protein
MTGVQGIPRVLRWFLFAVGVGCLVACGVYLGRGVAESGASWRLLRALMFLLLGLFFVLMYGENKSAVRRSDAPPGPN